MKAKFVLPLLLIVVISLAMTFLYFESRSPASKRHNFILAQLELVKHTNFELNENVFEVASGLLHHYDSISSLQTKLSHEFNNLRNAENSLALLHDPTIDAHSQRLADAIAFKNKLIERFKHNNALLNNSLRYYPRLITEINALIDTDKSYLPYHDLVHSVIYFTISQNNNFLKEAKSMIKTLKSSLASEPTSKQQQKHFLTNFLAHSEIILNAHNAKIQLSAIKAQPTVHTLLKHLHDTYVNYHTLQTEDAEQYRQIMFAASLLLIAIVAYMLILLGRSAIELAKQKENALAANQAKSAFLANMSHEIRTPLTAIIGFGESTLDSNQSLDERLSAVNSIVRNGKHLLHVINEILDISKIESGKLTTEKLPANLFEIIGDLNTLLEMDARNKGLTFTINYEFPLPETITTDPIRLKQILLNLCNNAIKFTERGQVSISVSSDHERFLKFVISDSGIGLSQEHIDKLCSPFTQADSTTTRKYGGTGLGLHISKHLIEHLGGKLNIFSVLNQGSQFSFNIDAGDLKRGNFATQLIAARDQDKKPVKRTQAPQLQGSVLLAEDNTDNQALISYYLRKSGVSVAIAENGLIALNKALETEFDLVFMDMQMPEMDGLEATQQLRIAGYKKPIVALTANASKEDAEKCYHAGCDEFLSKPIDWQKFYETLSKHLELKQHDEQSITPIKSHLADEDPEILKLVVNLIEALPERLQEIGNALEQQQWDALSGKLHQLKGLGGNYGYPQLSNLSARMEFEVKKKELDEVRASFKELQLLVTNIRAGSPKEVSSG